MNKITISFIVFILFIPLTIYASDFDFYGLKFGDTEDTVNKIFPLKEPLSSTRLQVGIRYLNNKQAEPVYKQVKEPDSKQAKETDSWQAKEPGHGMWSLSFCFDNNNCLYEIQAVYVLAFSAETKIARVQAIDELFIQPLQKQKDIEVKTEIRTGPNGRDLLILTLVYKPLQNEYIKQLKEELIQEMK